MSVSGWHRAAMHCGSRPVLTQPAGLVAAVMHWTGGAKCKHRLGLLPPAFASPPRCGSARCSDRPRPLTARRREWRTQKHTPDWCNVWMGSGGSSGAYAGEDLGCAAASSAVLTGGWRAVASGEQGAYGDGSAARASVRGAWQAASLGTRPRGRPAGAGAPATSIPAPRAEKRPANEAIPHRGGRGRRTRRRASAPSASACVRPRAFLRSVHGVSMACSWRVHGLAPLSANAD